MGNLYALLSARLTVVWKSARDGMEPGPNFIFATRAGIRNCQRGSENLGNFKTWAASRIFRGVKTQLAKLTLEA